MSSCAVNASAGHLVTNTVKVRGGTLTISYGEGVGYIKWFGKFGLTRKHVAFAVVRDVGGVELVKSVVRDVGLRLVLADWLEDHLYCCQTDHCKLTLPEVLRL